MSDLSIRIDDYEADGGFVLPSSYSEETMKRESTDKVTKAIKVIFAILLFCVALEFVFYKFISPSIQTPRVSVTGSVSYSPEEVVELLRPMNATNWFNFDVESAVSILASISAFDSVSVRKTFPNKIYINIIEREPVAMTFVNNNGRSVAMQIDRNGVIFPEKASYKSENSMIPIISGLPVEHMTEGMRIPPKYRPLIEQISKIRNVSQKYFAAISEICVVPKESGTYELMLIPNGSKIKVLTDRSLNEDALKYMMVALDVVNSIEPSVKEIDLRYGSVSYRKR
ncbi:MAG: FtsQ-type POTRA domain-containing protein [Treponema sp.]|nr:FtsQ-type POTRA domain-containing protein [Treponema sp.]